MKQDLLPNDINPFITHPAHETDELLHIMGSTPHALPTNSSVGFFTSQKNDNRERAVRRILRFVVLIRED